MVPPIADKIVGCTLPSHSHWQNDDGSLASYNHCGNYGGHGGSSGQEAARRPTRSPAIRAFHAILLFCVALALPCIYWGSDRRVPDGLPPYYTQVGPKSPNETSEYCPQAEALLPVKYGGLAKQLDAVYADEQFKLAAYKRLTGAVQVPTESYDDLGPVGVDPRWNTFAKLHEYLEETFPKVFLTLEVVKVNTYGIVLRWKGSDPSSLPVLITAHQDVVPVESATVKDWTHPPYSGHYDGTWIWGRGSCDDKSDLIASLHAITALLEKGFNPTRTFIWAFGFDEEASGSEGAGHIAAFLEKEYGTNGFAALLDEGGRYAAPYGPSVIFVMPSLAEKGYLDVRVEVSTTGGHSSVPPPHTAIGLLSLLLVELEAHPHTPALVRGSSAHHSILCAATYGPAFPEPLRALAFQSTTDDAALDALRDALLAAQPQARAVLGTTQAVDVVAGGVKVNALPELASALVNHRIAQHERVADVQAHVTSVILPVARRFNLSVDAFGQQLNEAGGAGHIRLSDAFGTALEPSPVTPTGSGDPYQVLAGTVKATLESARGYNASGVVVAPQIILGNTDTRYYWNLTKNIFRYRHMMDKDSFNGAHTVNEAIRGEGFIESIRFFTKFVLNFDEHL